MATLQEDPYQFLPQPPTFQPLEYEGSFFEAVLGDADPPLKQASQVNAIGDATTINGSAAVVYELEETTRRVVIEGERKRIPDTRVRYYAPATNPDGQNVIHSGVAYLSQLP